MNQGFSRYDRKKNAESVYCYPGTDVLVNILGIRNSKDLASFEADITLQRQYELEHEYLIRGRFGAAHLKNIHKYIFQDIYPFAGKYRVEDLWKGDTFFCKSEHIHENLKRVLAELKNENYIRNLGLRDCAARLAFYMSELNMIHPFREGNGRAIREFIRVLGLQANYIIDWSRVDAEILLQATITSVNGDPGLLTECMVKTMTRIVND